MNGLTIYKIKEDDFYMDEVNIELQLKSTVKTKDYQDFWLDEFESVNDMSLIKTLDALTKVITDILFKITNGCTEIIIKKRWKNYKRRENKKDKRKWKELLLKIGYSKKYVRVYFRKVYVKKENERKIK